MKRTISTLLAVLFALTAFGVTALFGGVLGAGAVFYDYYEYTQFPGLNSFDADDYSLAWKKGIEFAGLSSDCLPAGDPVDNVASFTVVTPDKYGGVSLGTMRQRNADPECNSQNHDYSDSPNWTANDKLNGKDIFGDSGLDFEDATGVCFWVGLNGSAYGSTIKLSLFTVPSQGPYYVKSEDGTTEMGNYQKGFVYTADNGRPDEDGYYYFDFKSSFHQVDWWSVDDDGINWYKQANGGAIPNAPFPASKLPYVNAFQIRFNSGVQQGDTLYVGDFRIYRDTRIHVDELEEQCAVFDSLDPEQYTEASYASATEVYLEAYNMLQNPGAYTQRQIDNQALALKQAIRDLQPMFPVEKKDVLLAGFEVWDDDAFDEMTGGGVCADTPAVDYDNVPLNREQSVLVFANAVDGPPTYGWSLFTNATEDGAVGNPFALLDGSEPLSAASGVRFWLKWDESMGAAPTACRVGLGVSEDELYFECEETAVALPEKEGCVGVAWSAFYDVNGDEDIYDHIDDIDTIYIYLEGATGIYYLADLTGFEWSNAPADFTDLITVINEKSDYMASINKSDYYYVSWNQAEQAISYGRSLLTKYGVTQAEVQEAIERITKAINSLTLLGDLADEPTMNLLRGLCQNGKTYWRGNVTPRSYIALKEQIENAEALLFKGPKQAEAEQAIADMRAAIAGLVPITAGERVTTIHSFESYSGRDLSRATGDRTENVTYSLDKKYEKLPEGYGQALKMTAQTDMSSETGDEHGVMQFKAMYRDAGNHVNPIMIGNSEDPKANTLIGDLSGTDGICLWVGVNDVNLVQECRMRFSVSNCSVSKFFERSAIDIPIPATGQGWIYLPWESFEYYDWTDEEINLAKIYFYIIRFDGVVKSGLEVYVTGIHAYKNTTAGEWSVPVIANVTEGAEYDLSQQELIPDWNVGAALLDGENLIYGDPVVTNGEHELVVTNGDKSATVRFTTTGAVEYETPVVNVESGKEYVAPLAVVWDVGVATLNGEPVESGCVIETPGGYVLEVVNGTKSVSVRFTVKEDAPPPANKPGDMDKDGEISVNDALRALRIAAKLAEATEEDMQLGDVDKDGDITVNDALKILRVAAKLAGEDSLG